MSFSDRGGESALTTWAQRQRGNGRLQGSEGVRAIRSRSDGEIRLGKTDVCEAAPLLSATVKSPELRQVRARVAPGSPELGRGEEGATASSMGGKGPRIHGQRGENGGEKASGGPEELR